jgi:hypothetical protein
MDDEKLNFLDKLSIYKDVAKSMILSREGRKYLFGIGEAEIKRIRRLNSDALAIFTKEYPEIDIHGSISEFDGGVQYLDDGIRQVCQLREKYEIESTFNEIKQYPNATNISKFFVIEGEVRQIPNTFIEYKSYTQYIDIYNRSLNIILADLWLHENFPEVYDISKINPKRKISFDNEEINIFDFINLLSSITNTWRIPVANLNAFFHLEREDMLLTISRFLFSFGENSTLNQYGLDFNFVDEKYFFIKQDMYNNDGVGIEFWCRVIYHKMGSNYDIYEDKPNFYNIYNLMN